MHAVSSITITPPDPAIEPAAISESKSMLDVDLRCGEHLGRDPARNDGLERPAFTDSLCVAFDQLTQGHADWRFVESRAA